MNEMTPQQPKTHSHLYPELPAYDPNHTPQIAQAPYYPEQFERLTHNPGYHNQQIYPQNQLELQQTLQEIQMNSTTYNNATRARRFKLPLEGLQPY